MRRIARQWLGRRGDNREGIGLRGMSERVAAQGGSLSLVSTQPSGALLSARLPLLAARRPIDASRENFPIISGFLDGTRSHRSSDEHGLGDYEELTAGRRQFAPVVLCRYNPSQFYGTGCHLRITR